jgi:hypothetical protein
MKKTTTKKEFPETLYVAKEEEATEEEYLACDASMEPYATVGQERRVAVYSLVRVVTLTAKLVIEEK